MLWIPDVNSTQLPCSHRQAAQVGWTRAPPASCMCVGGATPGRGQAGVWSTGNHEDPGGTPHGT